jgi:hypothetical protein
MNSNLVKEKIFEVVLRKIKYMFKKLVICIDRTSVCLGDDTKDHKQIMKIRQNCSVIELSKIIKKSIYLK